MLRFSQVVLFCFYIGRFIAVSSAKGVSRNERLARNWCMCTRNSCFRRHSLRSRNNGLKAPFPFFCFQWKWRGGGVGAMTSKCNCTPPPFYLQVPTRIRVIQKVCGRRILDRSHSSALPVILGRHGQWWIRYDWDSAWCEEIRCRFCLLHRHCRRDIQMLWWCSSDWIGLLWSQRIVLRWRQHILHRVYVVSWLNK